MDIAIKCEIDDELWDIEQNENDLFIEETTEKVKSENGHSMEQNTFMGTLLKSFQTYLKHLNKPPKRLSKIVERNFFKNTKQFDCIIRYKKECFACGSPQFRPCCDKVYHFVTCHKDILLDLTKYATNDSDLKTKAEFAARYILAYSEKLEMENIIIKNVEKAMHRLGKKHYVDFIKKDIKMGLTAYFMPTAPYFILTSADTIFLEKGSPSTTDNTPPKLNSRSSKVLSSLLHYPSWVAAAVGTADAQEACQKLLQHECPHYSPGCTECTYSSKRLILCEHGVTKCPTQTCYNIHRKRFKRS